MTTSSAEQPRSEGRSKLVDAARANVPEGTYAVGAGLMVAALTAYGFQILAEKKLTDNGYNALNALWVMVFVVAPGFFQPLEQEIARALAHRRAQGTGGGPVVKRAAQLGAVLAAAVALAAIVAAPLWLIDNYFHDEPMMLICLLVALVTYYAAHITRGTLSGNGRFGAYGLMHGSEGILRIVFVGAVFAAGSTSPGLFGLALVVPPAFAVLISLRGQKNLIEPGPDAPYSELSGALTLLLVGTALAQLMSYAPVIAANVLSGDVDDDALAGFITGMFIARIPILLFQAVQASLLPKLAGYAGDGRHDDFRSGLRKLLVVVIGIGVIGVIAGGTIGPTVGEMLFTEKWTLGNRDLALLAAGAGAFILALTLSQGLIALRGYKSVALAWSVGIAAFVAAMPIGSDVFLRAEIAFVVSSLTASALMAVLLVLRMRVATATIEDLVEVVEHEQLEI